MLTNDRRADRGDLGRAIEVEGARHSEACTVGEGNQGADLARLRIVCRFVDREHRAEGHAGRFEERLPFRLVALGEDPVENFGQHLMVGAPRRLGGEAFVLGQVLGVDRLEEARKLARLVVQRHQEPASVATAIVVGERARRVGTWRPVRHVLAKQPVLHVAAVCP